MTDLSSTYLGLKLKNPIIVSSSGLTNSAEKIQKLAQIGVGAVVIKSLFEEQINYEAGRMIAGSDYPEAGDYILNYSKSNTVDEYLSLIEDAKKSADIPVIASINCVSAKDWISFARQIEQAGADALELNVFFLPTEKEKTAQQYEDLYYSIVTEIKKHTAIPVAVKLGMQFTNILGLLDKLYFRGVAGAVLFNRFYSPDIDIDTLDFTASEVFSNSSDLRHTLRWVAIASSKVKNIDISASTGVHDAASVIKLLLAGASSVQVCSVLYKNGVTFIDNLIKGLETWMKQKNYSKIDDFRGKLNYGNIKDPTVFERSQFMRYFSNMH
ncbi:MAG: dihydroorotate dehydrogenase-like protein [Bacteroidales bacterium]|nr:dihydroorotate dehydrogenase-like protein [Bacteroidales bacterium]